jgi:hypothetical protein
MDPLDAFYAIQLALGAEEHAARIAEARRAFEKRAGAFGPEDPWFEARSRAFWDDAVTCAELAELARGELPDAARAWLEPLSRAHRGLFERTDDPGTVLRDLVSGAELIVDVVDAGTRDALDALGDAAAPFDGRVVAGGSPVRIALLPGAVFHPDDAGEPIAKLLETPRARDLAPAALLDALLRMELSLRKLSRVKASYAYRL